MKSCLICPANCPSFAAYERIAPLSVLPILGKSLLEYWLDHLADQGVDQVRVLAPDRPEMVRELVGNGARWGLNAEVIPGAQDLSAAAAPAGDRPPQDLDCLPEPQNTILMNHLPGQPQQSLFTSYAGWFSALLGWLPRAATANRVGVRELRPGIWVGLRAWIAPTAQLRPPCWIGASARIGPRSIIGPMAILEDRVVVESDCEILTSIIGPETLIAEETGLQDFLAWGGTLVNWKTGVSGEAPDPFLICALRSRPSKTRTTGWLAHLAGSCVSNKEKFRLFPKRQAMKPARNAGARENTGLGIVQK